MRGDRFGHAIQKPASVQNAVIAARYRQSLRLHQTLPIDLIMEPPQLIVGKRWNNHSLDMHEIVHVVYALHYAVRICAAPPISAASSRRVEPII
jgi:hypothetical protein